MKCDKNHSETMSHIPIQGRKETSASERYPLLLCNSICNACNSHMTCLPIPASLAILARAAPVLERSSLTRVLSACSRIDLALSRFSFFPCTMPTQSERRAKRASDPNQGPPQEGDGITHWGLPPVVS